jgi:hypothetical protein
MRNQSIKAYFIATSMSLMFGIAPLTASATGILNLNSDLVPTGKGYGIKSVNYSPVSLNTAIPQNGIYFHGGNVLGTSTANTPNIYIIWYGNWASSAATNIISNFARGVGASPYFNINTTYQNSAGQPVLPKVNFNCGVYDNYSQGTSLTDSSINAIVKNAINTKNIPLDPNGVYFVLTSPDVKETSGFCTSYCGWHTSSYMTVSSGKSSVVQYAFVGNASQQCPGGCEAQSSVSPNGNPGVDGMISVFAHELEESVTDPSLSAWYDNNGSENADKCAWTFGTTSLDIYGAKYNMTVNKMNYLVQQNWVNANNGYCAMSYP